MKPFVLGLVGPTATGKTALVLALKKSFPIEVISADSMQVYRGLDIGTAKPTRAEQRKLPHHAIDMVSPQSSYSIYRYRKDALKALAKIVRGGKIPVVVGGSGLYIQTLFDGLTQYPKTSPGIRKKLEQKLKKEGLASLLSELDERDPVRAGAIDRRNPRRVIRALEMAFAEASMKGESPKRLPSLGELGYDAALYGLTVERASLYKRVEERIDDMFRKGLYREARKLLDTARGKTVRQAIGYREFWESDRLQDADPRSAEGKRALKDISEKIKKNTRHLVKKQITWFSRRPNIEWLDVTTAAGRRDALKKLKDVLKLHYAH